MPNPIKYSTGSETLALKKGNLYIGTGDVGKGPSDTTGYYNGVSPSSGGYVIYMNKTGAPGNLSYHNAPTDEALISFTNNLAGQSYTGVNQCLVYYAGQTDKVCVNRDYESIITNGLVLNLDAGFTPSYPTSGTTWYDVSSGGNNGSLINGPTFNSGNGGSIVFDGTNDYVSLTNNTSLNFTVSCWIKTTATSLTGNEAYLGNGIIWSDVSSAANDFILAILNNKASWFTGNPDSSVNGTTIINTGGWFYLVGTRNATNNVKQLFVNGVSEGTGYTNSNLLTANPNIAIGANTLDARYFNGSISVVQFYNRVLTSDEILQNYNATKSRFGL